MYQSLPEIPAFDRTLNASSCRNIPIDLSDSRAMEPLVKLADFGIACESFYACKDGTNWPYHEPINGAIPNVWTRLSVAQKLVQVNNFLQPYGAELLALDGYRSIECQKGLWDFFWRQAERDMPDSTPHEKLDFVRTFVSDPTRFSVDDPTSWPGHSTGGSVDVVLKKINAVETLDMGARFDEMAPSSATTYFEDELKYGRIMMSDVRLINRRLLYAAMQSAGFTNFPHEFWHYDFGNQMHILYAQALPATAWYGYVAPPEVAL